MTNETFSWNSSDVLITYDLTRNDISAGEIANYSSGKFSTTVNLKNDSHTYPLPNTTLWYSGSRDTARIAFINAFNAAKKDKMSPAVINRLLITEVKSCNAYIED